MTQQALSTRVKESSRARPRNKRRLLPNEIPAGPFTTAPDDLGQLFYLYIALANAYIEQIEQINSSCNGGCRVKVDPDTKTIEPCTALYLSCRLFS